MAPKTEVIIEVFVFGEWYEVERGTMRKVTDYPGMLERENDVWTWLLMGQRYYARSKDILGVKSELSQSET